jgi:FtsP/CotA-like multicopper oxidase with cupredoxin domain
VRRPPVHAGVDQGPAQTGPLTTDPHAHPRRLGRRAFLGALGGAALGLALPGGARRWDLLGLGDPSTALAAVPFRARLPIPPVLREDHIRIPIEAADAAILPGPPTRLWTFGGSFPGPTIRRPAGRRTLVTYEHRLPRDVGELSVHFHGGHNRSRFDGQPGGLTGDQPVSFYCDVPLDLSPRQSGNDLLIRPGGELTYVYDLREDGLPARASFRWYHDHRLDRTALHAWHGLAGMWIIDDELEDSLPLPRGARDLPLMFADRSFDGRNQLTDPFTDLRPPDDGTAGARILVNGAFMPHHVVDACRYRLRLLNVSAFRSYNFELSSGAALVQIATDSGLMPRPVPRRQILLGPAERAEVIVDFSPFAGEAVELRSSSRHPGPNPLGAHTYSGALMQFRVGGRVADDTRVPRRLRPLPEWTRHVRRKPDHTWTITVGGLFKTTWLINGRTFDPAYADAHPVLGSTVTWAIHNRTRVAHVLHLHHTDWYLLSRDGRPPPPWEDCLKETFFVFPGERIVVAGHLTDYAGKFVIHCHMLDHEDHGLMSQFAVVRG